MQKGREKGCGRLSVFKGREARLNRAIFHILALASPLIPYDIYKEVKAQRGLRYTKYTNVLRRIKALEKAKYLEKAGTRKTQAGPDATLYQITLRPYIAILLKQLDLDKLIHEADEETITTELAVVALFLSSRPKKEIH